MAYILFANPAILHAAGVPLDAAIAGTAAVAAVASMLMGVVANVPIALAPGMGLNAVVAFQVAAQLGSWQAAMGVVILDGIVVLLFVLAGLREAVLHAIPIDLRRAIGAGIGLFIAFIGLVNARLVIVPAATISGLAGDPGAHRPFRRAQFCDVRRRRHERRTHDYSHATAGIDRHGRLLRYVGNRHGNYR